MKELLDLYSDYLLASFGATTATGLSKLLDGAVSHDQVTRYLSSHKKTSADLWLRFKPLVRRMQSAAGVLIIDDSIEEKPYTDENEIVCWHYENFYDPVRRDSALGNQSPIAFELAHQTKRIGVTVENGINCTLSHRDRFAGPLFPVLAPFALL